MEPLFRFRKRAVQILMIALSKRDTESRFTETPNLADVSLFAHSLFLMFCCPQRWVYSPVESDGEFYSLDSLHCKT